MRRIVECVPNFSEGRDLALIGQITGEIEKIPDVKLLDVDPGADTNRTVVTFVGSPDAVVEAAFQAIRKASELIDMQKHQGAHARMGATDVCPFVPVGGVTMEECAELARRLGKRVGEELQIPVYLYEYAAASPQRSNLADIRAGEYEGLAEKLTQAEWKPDFGPARMNIRSGATVIGARRFLIAYNVNLNTRDRRKATDIALDIREKGRARRDENGKIVRDAEGQIVRNPGILKAVKAVGWYIDEYQMAQISMNLVDMETTPFHAAFDEVERQAGLRGLRVTGSELVGLIPLQAMLAAGRHYLKRQGSSTAVSERELVRIAIQSLGLNEISPFTPEERIIEYQLQDRNAAPLIHLSVNDLVDELASDSPAPGGGSISSLAAALAAGLTAMVAALSYGKKGYEEVADEIEEVGIRSHHLKDRLLALVDADTASFNAVMSAMRLPRKTEEQQEARQAALQQATLQSIDVPLEVSRLALEVLDLARRMGEIGNQNSLSDAGVAVLQSRAALEGAAMNVLINLPGLQDTGIRTQISTEIAELRTRGVELAEKTLREIDTKLKAEG